MSTSDRVVVYDHPLSPYGQKVKIALQEKGVPGMVERTLIRPPSSKLGPATRAERAAAMAASPVAGKYDRALDRDSAHEMLAARAAAAAEAAGTAEALAEEAAPAEREYAAARRFSGPRVPRSSSRGDGGFGRRLGAAVGDALLRELGGTTGRRVVRGLLGGLFKGR